MSLKVVFLVHGNNISLGDFLEKVSGRLKGEFTPDLVLTPPGSFTSARAAARAFADGSGKVHEPLLVDEFSRIISRGAFLSVLRQIPDGVESMLCVVHPAGMKNIILDVASEDQLDKITSTNSISRLVNDSPTIILNLKANESGRFKGGSLESWDFIQR